MPILMHAITGLTGCDERCYDAKHDTCVCVCGGVNHGRGLRRASENARRIAEQQGQTSLTLESAPAPAPRTENAAPEPAPAFRLY
jgi:hypothetical protein